MGPEERVGSEFESLVRHCKDRAAELFNSKEKGPPEIQLGKSSRTTISRYGSLISEIIDDQLELAHLQAEVEMHETERQAAERQRQLESEADEAERQNALARARDKAKLFKKQAEIQAKLRKQQSMGSQYSVRSSRKSKSSKASRSIKAEVEQRLGSGFIDFNLGGHTSNVVKIGTTSGAAAKPEEPQNEPKEKETTKLALANGAAQSCKRAD